jgi:8-hydroxy-5-deazaflavin:NADPH oxidoreductase
VVKAFNAILQGDLATDGRPAGTPNRRALPIVGDDAEAKRVCTGLIDQFGFDVVDAGPLAEGWRFQRAMPAYCIPLDTAGLREALAAAQRGVEVPHGSWRRR